jgi:hypothetical protein
MVDISINNIQGKRFLMRAFFKKQFSLFSPLFGLSPKEVSGKYFFMTYEITFLEL